MIVKLQPSRDTLSIFCSLKLYSYCIDLHQNFTRCRGIRKRVLDQENSRKYLLYVPVSVCLPVCFCYKSILY